MIGTIVARLPTNTAKSDQANFTRGMGQHEAKPADAPKDAQIRIACSIPLRARRSW